MLENSTKINPEHNGANNHKSESSRAPTPSTNLTQSVKSIVQKQPNKVYSINLKPIMKYINKDGQLIDTMKDQAAFNEKDLENRIG
jgi:uncharacterized protein (UPF0333 family)